MCDILRCIAMYYWLIYSRETFYALWILITICLGYCALNLFLFHFFFFFKRDHKFQNLSYQLQVRNLSMTPQASGHQWAPWNLSVKGRSTLDQPWRRGISGQTTLETNQNLIQRQRYISHARQMGGYHLKKNKQKSDQSLIDILNEKTWCGNLSVFVASSRDNDDHE